MTNNNPTFTCDGKHPNNTVPADLRVHYMISDTQKTYCENCFADIREAMHRSQVRVHRLNPDFERTSTGSREDT